MSIEDPMSIRMKSFEDFSTNTSLFPKLPICLRLDGRGFSKLTKKLKGAGNPFNQAFFDCMLDLTKFLVKETNALIGYTQSDEITLIVNPGAKIEDTVFGGRLQKIASVFAAMASVEFNFILEENDLEQLSARSPVFDCRVWNVPSKEEAANVLLWRERDATRNSLTMAALAYYNHKEVLHKNSSDKHEMLHQKEVNWNDYPIHFKRGIYVRSNTVTSKYSTEDLGKLPPQHAARKNPNLEIIRKEYVEIDMPPFEQVVNRADVIFKQEDPRRET